MVGRRSEGRFYFRFYGIVCSSSSSSSSSSCSCTVVQFSESDPRALRQEGGGGY
jgi:hypothetical protein